MPNHLIEEPLQGRLFKMFTDFGPYFRELKSDDKNFFFDCLEICVDATVEPEKRVFLGWWMVITRDNDKFTYQRFNGLFDINGDWTEAELDNKHLQQIDQSFNAVMKKLTAILEAETGYKLTAP
ncbi:sigma factor-binding protein Crl [Psychromonas aquatilis]|uniref:Sigma factor-binding protein Crl n=1 Tax=Psychromonas aquatilis TaxID=2005072 RepID=A0ABU9GLF3_9GAMM